MSSQGKIKTLQGAIIYLLYDDKALKNLQFFIN